MLCACQRETACAELFLEGPSVRWTSVALHAAPREAMCPRCFCNAEFISTESVPGWIEKHKFLSKILLCELAKIVIQYTFSGKRGSARIFRYGSLQCISAFVPRNYVATDYEAYVIIKTARNMHKPELLTLVDLEPICFYQHLRFKCLEHATFSHALLDYWAIQTKSKWASSRDLARLLVLEKIADEDDLCLVQLAMLTGHLQCHNVPASLVIGGSYTRHADWVMSKCLF